MVFHPINILCSIFNFSFRHRGVYSYNFRLFHFNGINCWKSKYKTNPHTLHRILNTGIFMPGLFYLPNPILLLMIAGIWAALGLPIVNIGALYLVNKLDKELQPSNLTKIILTITLIFQLGIAGLLIFSQMSWHFNFILKPGIGYGSSMQEALISIIPTCCSMQ